MIIYHDVRHKTHFDMICAAWPVYSTCKIQPSKDCLHRAATFVPPLSDQKIYHDALGAVSIRKTILPGMAIPMLKIRRPNGRLIFNMEIAICRYDGLYIETGPSARLAHREFCFCVTAAARLLYLPWISNRSDRSMDATGRPKESHWWYKGGRSIAQIETQCLQQYTFFYGATNGRSLCINSATTAICVPSSCLSPLSDFWATDLLGDLCTTILDMLKTSLRPWRTWRGLNVLCATLERPRQPFSLLCAFNGDLASFVVAQGRHKSFNPCVKVVLRDFSDV